MTANSELSATGRGGAVAPGRFLRKHVVMIMGAAALMLVVLVSILAPLLWTVNPLTINPMARLQGPSEMHWLGTDAHGRDLYSRVVYGGRISLLVGISVALLSAIIGTVIGLVSGFVRVLDGVIMRIMDGIMAIPGIMLAIAMMALWGSSIRNVIIAITIGEVPRVSRLVRSIVLSLREQPYVEAAVSMGARTPRIIFRHILPNALSPIAIQATFICSSAMLAEATLSFIGAGTPPNVPSWGNILAEGRTLWQIQPGMIFYPALALSITVLAANLLGDGLNDILDPRRSSRR